MYSAVEFANILVTASYCPFIEFVGIFIHVLIELVKVYICQNRAYDTTLRIEEFPYQTKKSVICYSAFHYFYQHIMVYVVKEAFYISLDEPFCTVEIVL